MSKTAVREGRETRKPLSVKKSLEALRKELRANEPETKKEEPKKVETKKEEAKKVETKKEEAKKEIPKSKADLAERVICLEKEVDHLKAENTSLENKLKRQKERCDQLEKRLGDCEGFIVRVANMPM